MKPIPRRGSAGKRQARPTYTVRLSPVEIKVAQGLAIRQDKEAPIDGGVGAMTIKIAARFAFCKVFNRYPDFMLRDDKRLWDVKLEGAAWTVGVLLFTTPESDHYILPVEITADPRVYVYMTYWGGSTFEIEGWDYAPGGYKEANVWKTVDGGFQMQKKDLRQIRELLKSFFAGRCSSGEGEVKYNEVI